MDFLISLRDRERAQWLATLLIHRGHTVSSLNEPLRASGATLPGPPDCVITEPDRIRRISARLVRVWKCDEKLPTVLVHPNDSWRAIVAEAEEACRRCIPDEMQATSEAPPSSEIAVFDPLDVTSRAIDAFLREMGYGVQRLASTRKLVLHILNDRPDCVLLGPAPDGLAPIDLIRSLALIRAGHPKSFLVLALVDREDDRAFEIARTAGADAVVVRRSLRHIEERIRSEFAVRLGADSRAS